MTTRSTQTSEILTLYEASKRLKVSERTLWQLARDGAVPHFRVGRQYRFLTTALDEWGRRQAAKRGSNPIVELKREANRLGFRLVAADEMGDGADG